MAKKLAKIVTVGVLIIMSLSIFGGCGNNKPTEQAQSGAYFVTGSGSEFAVVHEDKLSVFLMASDAMFFSLQRTAILI